MKTAESRTRDEPAEEPPGRSQQSPQSRAPAASPDEPTVTRLPDGGEHIHFGHIRETATDLWQHALTTDYTIEKQGRPDLFIVYPPTSARDAPVAHNCSLCHLPGPGPRADVDADLPTATPSRQPSTSQTEIAVPPAYGWCSCPMFDARGICSHLSAIVQAATVHPLTIPWYDGPDDVDAV